MHRAGKLGGLAAWLGFTLPSAVILTALAIWARGVDLAGAGWVHGLELAAAAVVATAVIAMARTLARGAVRLAIAVAAAAVALLVPGAPGQVATIVVAGAIGAIAFRGSARPLPLSLRFPIGRRTAVACALCFVVLLVGLPLASDLASSHALSLVDGFYRSGALVFGGGHVVLPLLNDAVVETGWVSQQAFLAGYGAAQAVPGPLFTFSAYLGAIEEPSPERGRRRVDRARGDLPAVVPALRRGAAALVGRPRASRRAGGRRRDRGRRRRASRGRTVGSRPADVGPRSRRRAFALVLFGLLRVLPPWAVVGIAAAAGAVLL